MPEIIEIPGWGLATGAVVVGVTFSLYAANVIATYIKEVILNAQMRKMHLKQEEEEARAQEKAAKLTKKKEQEEEDKAQEAAELAEKISTHLPGPWAELYRTMEACEFWEATCAAVEAFQRCSSAEEAWKSRGKKLREIPRLTPQGLEMLLDLVGRDDKPSKIRISRVHEAVKYFMVPYEGWTTNEVESEKSVPCWLNVRPGNPC